MADLTAQQVDIDGLTPSYEAADTEGDSFLNNGDVFLHVKNGDASTHTVTLTVQKSIDYGTLTDPSVDVAAGAEAMIGPFDREWFNDSNKKVSVTYDDVTSVTVAVLKL